MVQGGWGIRDVPSPLTVKNILTRLLYLTIVTLLTHFAEYGLKFLYNVRFIEYPTGYHVRIYQEKFDRMFLDDVLVSDSSDDVSCDDSFCSVPLGFSFDDLERGCDAPAGDAEESLRVSMCRTKNMVYHIARSNIWDYFVTFTLNGELVDRYNFQECSRKARKLLNNLKQRRAHGLYYILVPEQHKDGAYHFHGLIGGCDGIRFVDSGHRDKSGRPILNMTDWKYGFSTCTSVDDPARASTYICKYITKTLCSSTKGLRRYWASANCKRAEVEEYLCDDLPAYRMEMLDKVTWKKVVENGFYKIEYWEIPKEKGSGV